MGSLSQRILEGLNVSLIGMTITILSLFLLSLTIILLSKVVSVLSNRQAGAPGSTGGQGGGGGGDGSAVAAPSVQTAAPPPQDTVDNSATGGPHIRGSELVAVLAAAIACATGADAASFRVVSYKRTRINAPVWNARGRNDYLSAKL